ncbi:heme ABC exporter ATP-binding protein CcmA [Aquibium oceanicum]|uniref:Heme ABC exporter, ATP-binding protein CcmA n=1 Tax=Aquibium oceanicum TaxID=1670800 RepID=A0A1L3SY02_9HYPH|nr:heme ABC exporter ATP-binding protein CcmA [Aquibium oceanicum]APH74299.1 heme ABC exporter, ATP-binding protein CcmA [Aquibium oceanicum]
MRMIARELSGERGGEPVFSGISFTLADGEGLLVTGPNGSGKSTLLRIVAGLLPSSGGTMEIADADARWPDIASASHYLGHQNALKPALSVRENLGFWRDYMGEPHLAVTEALEMVGLEEIGHLPLGYLSTGQKRRIAIARLLVSYRPVWLLDEPTAGLDRASEKQFADLMRTHLEDGGMILAATHLPLGLEWTHELRMGA